MMHTGSTGVSARVAHWRSHYQREVERVSDELRLAEARMRARMIESPNAPEKFVHQNRIAELQLSLEKFRASLARWSAAP